MDNILNCKIDKQTIYQIYRACRLCGAGAGYKMPIIQNVVDLDARGIELKQKIRDCVQIEVHPDDKMPPLICELCVDKVNDYYDFMELCQLSNKRTRARLGLPSSAGKVRDSNCQDSADCILGITEKVYTNDDSDEPLSGTTRRSKNEAKVKIKVEKETPKSFKSRGCQTDFREPSGTENKSQNSRESRKVSDSGRESRKVSEISRESRKVLHNSRESRKVLENSRESRKVLENSRESRKVLENSRESRKVLQNSRESRKQAYNRSRSSSPVAPRVTRHARPPTPPRPTRLARSSYEENLSLSNLKNQTKRTPLPTKSILKKSEDLGNLKRTREPSKPEIPQKKVKMSVPLKKQESSLACAICDKALSSVQALLGHQRSHGVGFTSAKLACNACRDWFPSPEEASAHHRNHKAKKKPYHCKRCGTKYKLQEAYDLHILSEECLPWDEVPDVKCEECWRTFPTRPLLETHRCGGQDSRPGGKCIKCNRTYALQRNLKKHELTCTIKKKKAAVVSPALRAAAVRLARCDALLGRDVTCDASRVSQNYGLDPRCVYPFIRVKSELNKDHMVKIQAPLDAFDEEFVHWDSELTDSDEETNAVDSLTTIALKTIFSQKLLGKVPRKRRRIKTEKNAFDSVLNASEFENDMRSNIDNIIDNLGNDDNDFIDFGSKLDDTSDKDSVHSESLLFDDFSKKNDENSENRKDNDSVNSESLLCDDSAEQNEENVCNNAELNKPNESQGKFNDLDENSEDTRDSFTLSTKTDDISTNVENNYRSRDNEELTLNKDSSLSTECEEEIKDATERSEEAKEIQENLNELSRLRKPNDEVVESRPDCEKHYSSGEVVDENPQIERHDNNSNDVNTQSKSLNVDNKDEVINSNENTQIERRDSVNDAGTSSGSLNVGNENADHENVSEEHTNTDTEGTNNTCRDQLTNGKVGEMFDKLTCSVDERHEEKGDQKLNDDDIRENNDENVIKELVSEKIYNNCIEKSSDNHATELARTENDESIRQYKENEAMCNDIENKINDLIAENKANENSPENQDSSENSYKATEIIETTENHDNITKEYVATGSRDTQIDNDVTNNDVVVNNYSFPDEKDKITLEDLLPSKDLDARSMDLDSISDTEFDFDA